MIALPKISLRQLGISLPFIGIFVVVFWPTFIWMAQRFDAYDSFYSHGWLIPLASGWLVWQRREKLIDQKESIRSSFWGLTLLVPSLFVHTVSTWWDINFLSGFAMIFAIWGLVWTLWGRRALWTLRFPMLFLLFMVPLPGVLLISISFKMKMMAATLATYFVKLIGIPATQAGSTISIPGISVIVDDTCSGLRSLISLIALSSLWTSLMPHGAKSWNKWTIVAASVPIALAANMVRIVTLILLSGIYGPQIAESFIHYGSGIVVFGIAIAILAWLSNVLVNFSNPEMS